MYSYAVPTDRYSLNLQFAISSYIVMFVIFTCKYASTLAMSYMLEIKFIYSVKCLHGLYHKETIHPLVYDSQLYAV